MVLASAMHVDFKPCLPNVKVETYTRYCLTHAEGKDVPNIYSANRLCNSVNQITLN